MSKIKLIKQPNSWTCYPSVCCMITGEKVEDFIKYVGHDGSAYYDKSKHPEKVSAFWDFEALQYLASRRYFAFMNLPNEVSKHIDEECDITITFNKTDNEERFFILVVESQRFKGLSHVVLYHGGVVYDPNPLILKEPNIEDYKIDFIIPVMKL